jgi:AAA domain
MGACDCSEVHTWRRAVLTGGPGAGKTAVLELIRQYFCRHVRVLPETAGIVYGGGFPRSDLPEIRQAAQRAIFYVQRELETAADAGDSAIILCDREPLMEARTGSAVVTYGPPSEQHFKNSLHVMTQSFICARRVGTMGITIKTRCESSHPKTLRS